MTSKVTLATEFAQTLHKNQLRLSGETYDTHTLNVAHRLEDAGVTDERILAATILHHVLDNDQVTFANLVTTFGKQIADLVYSYNKLKAIHIKTDVLSKLDNALIIKTFLNLAQDLDAMAIRFADKCENVETSYVFPKEKRAKIATRALVLYAPICSFLGLEKFVKLLENQAFKILQPYEYYKTFKYLQSIKEDMQVFLTEAKTLLPELLQEENINAVVEGRLKHEYSVYKKNIKYQQKRNTLEDQYHTIYDTAAMRVIVDKEEQCYHVEDLLAALWERIDFGRDDYIQHPSPTGYQSLHVNYRVHPKFAIEFQIKTHEMHEQNEFGVSSHVFYKIGNEFKRKLKEDPDWLKKLNYWERDHVLEPTSNTPRIFTGKIYVFTPKGDIIELPIGSTPIDFAYALHTGIGNSCIGVKINGSIGKINSALSTGDTVEILTSKRKKLPSLDWLHFVKTTRARSQIRKELSYLW